MPAAGGTGAVGEGASAPSPRFWLALGSAVYAPNDAIDIWIVERALGQGGMGSVYCCHNRDAKRILAAIKVLDYGLKRSAKARARFVREAEILFSLDHPNIVKVRNVRLDADPPYLEMEFVEGKSLERRIMEGPVDARSVHLWLTQLASALAYLHGRGIRHRDLKPSNILVGKDGHAVLVDFGIATEADGSTLSESGQAMGSVAYVPPEWVDAGALDPVKWDLYALGVCAYEALTGDIAFGVPSGGMSTQRFYQVLTAKQGHPPLDPGANVPFALRELVRDLTRSEPDERVGTAALAVERLAAVDLSDVRADHVFADAGPAFGPGGARGNTPRGLTIIPTHGPEEGGAEVLVEDDRPIAAVAASRPSYGVVAAGVAVVALLTALGVLGVGAWWLAPPDPVAGVEEVPAPAAAVTPTTPVEPVAVVLPEPPAVVAPPLVAPVPPPLVATPKGKPPVAVAVEPAAATPDAVVVVVAATAGSPVTNAQLEKWLGTHPDWQKDAAVAAGKADDKYLRGWVDGAPPPGKESAPAVAVTWGLAKAYCGGRGLAPLEAEPLSWKESGNQPWMEYRQEAGAPRWRRDDGGTSDQVNVNQSGVFIGFRCAR